MFRSWIISSLISVLLIVLNGCAPSTEDIIKEKQKKEQLVEIQLKKEKLEKEKLRRNKEALYLLTKYPKKDIFMYIEKNLMNEKFYIKDQFETTNEYNKRISNSNLHISSQKFILDVLNLVTYSINTSGFSYKKMNKFVYSADNKEIYFNLLRGIIAYKIVSLKNHEDNVVKLLSARFKVPKTLIQQKIPNTRKVGNFYKLKGNFNKREARLLLNELDAKIVVSFKKYPTKKQIIDIKDSIAMSRRMRAAYIEGAIIANPNININMPLKWRYSKLELNLEKIIIYNKKTNKIIEVIE